MNALITRLSEVSPKVLRVLIYATLILVPIAFLPKGTVLVEAEISYIEVPKVFIFRMLTTLMLPFILVNLNWPRKNAYIPFLLFIFLAWTFLSTLFSINPQVSFWGEFFGQDSYSFLATLHYFIMFVAVVQTFRNKEEVLNLFKWITISGVLAATFVVFQKYLLLFHLTNVFPNTLIPEGIGRPPGTFGNPVFAGSFLSMCAAVTIYWIVETKQYTKKIPYILPSCASLGIIIAALVNTESRGALAALGVFVVLFGLLKLRSNKPLFIGILCVFTAAVLLVTIQGGLHRFTQAPEEIQARIKFWSGATYIASSFPFFGAGPDTFRPFYLSISPASEIGLPEEPDHAHSWYFHHLAELGYFGALLSFLVIIVPALLAPELLPLFASRGAEQLFGVARVSDIMLFYILVGAAHAYYRSNGFSLYNVLRVSYLLKWFYRFLPSSTFTRRHS